MRGDYHGMRRNPSGGRFSNSGRQATAPRSRTPLRVWLNRALLLGLIGLSLFFAGRYWWREARWRYIIIHHTASDIGNMDYYRKQHVEKRGWPDIAYHFLINNGSYDTGIGQVETSTLWTRRDINYSTQLSYINYFAIAVALVGNFENHPPHHIQMEALIQHVTELARRYDIPPQRIVGHREIWGTACPGKHLRLKEIRAAVRRNLAQ